MEGVLDFVIALLEQYRHRDFSGPITPETRLTNLCGENEWNTLGYAVVWFKLEDKFRVVIGSDLVDRSETVADLVKAVEQTIRERDGSPESKLQNYEFLRGIV